LEGSAQSYADWVRETVAARPEPFRPVPPLAPYPPEDVLSDLAAVVAAETVDLGVGRGGREDTDEKDEKDGTDTDDELLRAVAAVIVDLGLAGARP
jgi:hypothetical protein